MAISLSFSVAALTVDFPSRYEHLMEKVSHKLTAHATLEAFRVAVDVKVLDGDLGIAAHRLLAVCAQG